jgi:hypothetical protein
MTHIRPSITAWPYSRLRQDFPNVSFPLSPTAEDLAPFGVFPVVETAAPEYEPSTHRIEEVYPEEVNGEWQQRWTVVELTPEEQAAWQRANNPPRYEAFYAAFLNSNLYQALLVPALLQPGSDVLGNVMTIVALSLQDARLGNVPLPEAGAQPNSLQSAIWLLMSVMAPMLSPENLAELQGLLDAHGLGLYYSLMPPQQ